MWCEYTLFWWESLKLAFSFQRVYEANREVTNCQSRARIADLWGGTCLQEMGGWLWNCSRISAVLFSPQPSPALRPLFHFPVLWQGRPLKCEQWEVRVVMKSMGLPGAKPPASLPGSTISWLRAPGVTSPSEKGQKQQLLHELLVRRLKKPVESPQPSDCTC